jgi:hypothetical protein
LLVLWIRAAGIMAVMLAFSKDSERKYTSSQGEESGDGRCATSAMQREGIDRCCVLRQRTITRYDLRLAYEVKSSNRQRGHVQGLADMAGGIGPIRVLMKESSACGKIEQRGAS